MRFSNKQLVCWALGSLVITACSGKLQNVGDIDSGAGGEAGTSGSHSVGGGAGEAPEPTGNGGTPDSPLIDAVECQGCESIAEGTTIRDVATDAERVYWVEYGTFDDLGNYEDNGRLMSAPLVGGQPVVLADGLLGPTGVEVSSSYIYVAEELGPDISGALLRIPKGGGTAEIVGTLPTEAFGNVFVFDWMARSFVAHEGTAYWLSFGSMYKLPESEAGPGPYVDLGLGSRQPEAIFGDASNLYVSMVGIWKLPYAGPEALVETPVNDQTSLYSSFSTDGEYVYALDSSKASTDLLTPSYLIRTPLDAVAWKRLAQYPGKTTHLVLDGSDYFVDPGVFAGDQRVGCSIVQGKLGDAEAKTTLVSLPSSYLETSQGNCMVPWAASAKSVYVANGRSLYRVARAP
ncbi:MAG: hypothetical protein EOO73_36570 [Myxococcales bacterium]|nr:MAG: hypothetical protein EOO73_36570 [Myxococcales bacterium]